MNVPKHSRLFSRVWPKLVKNSVRAAAASARLSRGQQRFGPWHGRRMRRSCALLVGLVEQRGPQLARTARRAELRFICRVPLDTSGSASGGVPLDALRRVGRLVRLPDPPVIPMRSASDRWRQLPPIPRSPNRPMRRLAGPYFDTARAGFLAPGNRELKHAILQRGVDLR